MMYMEERQTSFVLLTGVDGEDGLRSDPLRPDHARS